MADRLEAAAVNATYTASLYHCPGPDRRRPARRIKPASHCPREWTVQEGINAVRSAIREGRVSVGWTLDGFPRRIWHQEGEVWYEARTSDRAGGSYHGYPAEVATLPRGLTP
jgi:hypothetical protein